MNLRKTKKLLLVVVMAILFLMIIPKVSFAGEQELNLLEFKIKLTDSGDMIVEEIWDIYLNETNTLFKTFPKDGTYSGITDVKVKEIYDDGAEVHFTKSDTYAYHVEEDYYHALFNDEDYFEIAWGVNQEYGYDDRKFSITYTVNDCVGIYKDTAELYWQLIGSDFSIFAKGVKGTIELPKEVENEDDLRIWAHGPLNGEIFKITKGVVGFIVENLPTSEFLEIRLAAPTSIFPNATNVHDEDKLLKIIAEETGYANEANLRREKAEKMRKRYKALCEVFLVVIIFFFSYKIPKNKKKLDANPKLIPEQKIDYFREIPDESASAIEAGFVYYYNKYNSLGDFGRSMSGTLMQLALKRWIEFEVINNGKKDDVQITVLKEGKTDLTEDEKMVYEWLVNISVANGNGPFNMKDFEKYCIKHNTAFNKFIVKITEKTRELAEKKGKYDKSQQKTRDVIILGIVGYIVGIVGMGLFAALTEANIIITIISELILLINLVLLIRLDSRFTGRTQLSVDEAEKWAGLKKYMEDFSLIKDREVPELVLWEKYLVFATVFGIADKVIKQLKVVYPELSNPDNLGSTYAYMHIACNNNTNFNFVNSINSSIGRATNYSSGSGAGGGFSSGGGGGRRRRWRRRSLISIYINKKELY